MSCTRRPGRFAGAPPATRGWRWRTRPVPACGIRSAGGACTTFPASSAPYRRRPPHRRLLVTGRRPHLRRRPSRRLLFRCAGQAGPYLSAAVAVNVPAAVFAEGLNAPRKRRNPVDNGLVIEIEPGRFEEMVV